MFPSFNVSFQEVALLLSVCFALYFGVQWLLKKDTEVEERRRGAAQIAATLKKYGLVHTPEFLIDYSVGDYSGMTKKIGDLARLFLSGEEQILKELNGVFDRVLTAKLATAEGRAYLAARVTQANSDAS